MRDALPLPNDARLWLFAIQGDPGTIVADLHGFMPSWRSHGRPVPAAAADLTPDGFPGLILAVAAHLSDAEVNAGVSGCGIDAMQHAVEAAIAASGAHLFPALSVAYHDGSAWHLASRPAFRASAKAGAVGPRTSVLDLTASSLGELREAGLVRTASEAWHGRAFRLAEG